MSKASSDETVLRAIAGDRDATQALLLDNYDRVQDCIARELPRTLQTVIQIEDVVQDTFVHAIRSLQQCNARTRDSFAAWLEVIANHRVLDAIRYQRARKRGGDWVQKGVGTHASSRLDPVEMLTHESTPGRDAARNEAAARVYQVVNELPAEQRRAIHSRYLDEASLGKTAEAMGRSPAAVRGLLHRAKAKLREALRSSSRWFNDK